MRHWSQTVSDGDHDLTKVDLRNAVLTAIIREALGSELEILRDEA